MKALTYPLAAHGIIRYYSGMRGKEVEFQGALLHCTEKYVFVGFDKVSEPLYGQEQEVLIVAHPNNYYIPKGVLRDDIVLMTVENWPWPGFLEKAGG